MIKVPLDYCGMFNCIPGLSLGADGLTPCLSHIVTTKIPPHIAKFLLVWLRATVKQN
jgi:hypothetical protein